MDNVCPEGNENQYVTSPSGEALGRNVNVRRSGLIRNSPHGDVTYWFSFPSGHTFSIETGISCLLALEPPFCAWPMGAWLPLVPGSLNYGISVLLVTLSLTTRSSSEDWGTWTNSDYVPLTLPTICSLAFLKRVNCSSAVNHSSSNSGLSSWSNMTWFLEFLDVTSLI